MYTYTHNNSRPFNLGTFVWSAFDYMGEALVLAV